MYRRILVKRKGATTSTWEPMKNIKTYQPEMIESAWLILVYPTIKETRYITEDRQWKKG